MIPLEGSLVFCWFGLDMRFGDESVFVSGVRVLTFREVPNVDILECAAGALKTEDAVLACELAEPTPFRRSPCRDSVSSAWGAAVSVGAILVSPAAGAGPALLARDCREDVAVSATDLTLGDPIVCDFPFSRSFALSLAARGAEGKNCAKLAPDARDIVGRRSNYLSLHRPTNISCLSISEQRYASGKEGDDGQIRAKAKEEIFTRLMPRDKCVALGA